MPKRDVKQIGMLLFIMLFASLPAIAQSTVTRVPNPTPAGSGYVGYYSARVVLNGDTMAISSDHASQYPYYLYGGIIHVFQRVGSDWQFEDTLRPPALQDQDFFGVHIALGGDLIAARYATNRDGALIPGVYLYRRVGTTWSLEHDFTNLAWPHISEANSLAIVNGMLLIGIDAAPGAPNKSGAVAIATETQSGWDITGYLPTPALNAGDGFGSAVAVSGNRCVVGAPFYRTDNEGGAFVYQFVQDQWQLEQEITVPVIDQRWEFGAAVAIHGERLAVNDPKQLGSGATYIYRLNESKQWVEEARLSFPGSWSGYVLELGDDFVATAGQARFDRFVRFHTHYFDGITWNQGFALDCITDYSECNRDPFPHPGQVFAIQGNELVVRVVPRTERNSEIAVLIGPIGSNLADDCNGNHLSDVYEIALGRADCNANGIPDECEPSPVTDCNNNDVCDAEEVYWLLKSADCNNNYVPDECEDFETDSDADGTPDLCDNCELFNPDQRDCDNDGVGDVCAIAAKLVEDCNGDGVPDSCADSYVVDDGTPVNHWIGYQSDFDCLCIQPFVAQTGKEIVNGISVYWTHFFPRPSTLLLYRDPNQDGDPNDAELLWQEDIFSGTREDGYITYAVPDVFVGSSGQKFFVGVAATGHSWPAWESASPTGADQRWIAADNIGEFDSKDLSTMAVLPPTLDYGQGPWMIRASASARAKCECIADIASSKDAQSDGTVDIHDLMELTANWGSCGEPCPPICAADLNGDCAVNVADLFFLLSRWGACE